MDYKFFDPETGKPLHRVPAGATIPKNTPHGYIRDGERWWLSRGLTVDWHQEDGAPRFTREPIAPPMPPLPTEPGAMIRAVDVDGDECAMMIRLEDGDWHGVDQDGDERFWVDRNITSWEPMTAIPTETWDRLRVLDPEDKRDRVDRDGDLMRFTKQSKAGWGVSLMARHFRYGPLRFADEVSDL